MFVLSKLEKTFIPLSNWNEKLNLPQKTMDEKFRNSRNEYNMQKCFVKYLKTVISI